MGIPHGSQMLMIEILSLKIFIDFKNVAFEKRSHEESSYLNLGQSERTDQTSHIF